MSCCYRCGCQTIATVLIDIDIDMFAPWPDAAAVSKPQQRQCRDLREALQQQNHLQAVDGRESKYRGPNIDQ